MLWGYLKRKKDIKKESYCIPTVTDDGLRFLLGFDAYTNEFRNRLRILLEENE